MARVVNQTHRDYVRQDYAGAREDWIGSRRGEEEPLGRVLVMTNPALEGFGNSFLDKLN